MKEKRRRLRGFGRRFSKFSTVGLTNAGVDLAVLNLLLVLYSTREPWLLALYNLAALVLANVNSYVLNSLWTFKGQAEHDLRQGVLFALQAVVMIGVSTALFWVTIRLLLDYTAITPFWGGNLAKILSTTVASTTSYFLQRHLVFSQKRRFGGRL